MKYDRDINNIRLLLDRYYRAETTAEEEQELEYFFSEAAPSDIPEDMKADASLFGLMSRSHPLPSDSIVPEDLMERLNAIVEESKDRPTSRRYPWVFKILRYSGVAAAACIVWAIVSLLPSPKQSMTEDRPALAHETASLDPPKDRPALAEETASLERTKDRPALAEKAASMEPTKDRPALAKVKRRPQPPKAEQSDGFIEITDPEEARKIALSIGKLLAQNADRTNDALAQIGNSIDSYKELTKSVLQ